VPASPTGDNATTYKVKEGDSLDKIAARHGTTVNALLKLNEIKRKNHLTVGSVIKIREAEAEETGGKKSSKSKRDARPASEGKKKAFVTYQVKKGDTIEVIAKRHHVSPDDLLSFNNMSRSDRLIADKKLKIPQ
jgi:LysM repeat protein